MTVPVPHPPMSRAWLRNAALLACALAAMLWVLAANGTFLFYFDTIPYIEVGLKVLDALRNVLPLPETTLPVETNSPAAGKAADLGINGSRSVVYALIAAIPAVSGAFGLLVVAKALLTALVSLAVVRGLLRRGDHGADPAAAALLPLVVCGFSALPFYVAYVMPDLMAPLGILAVAAVAAAARDLSRLEFAFLWCVATLSAMVHLSHLAIMVLMLPAAALAGLSWPRGWWKAPLFVVTVVAAGAAPLVVIKLAASRLAPAATGNATSDIVFTPFLTARLIVDGPGLTFLDSHCPDPGIATCRLHEALGWSDDPWRMTASHIIFETGERLGSLRLLPQTDQLAISQEQNAFFLMVLRADPLGVTHAFAVNTLAQAARTSIDMTLQTRQMLEQAEILPPDIAALFSRGNITRSRGWIDWIDVVHTGLYAVSAAVVLVLLVWPGRGPDRRQRVFALMVIYGLLANALICGGVSQPASRYGARVAWLLPYLAVFLVMVSTRPNRSSLSEAPV